MSAVDNITDSMAATNIKDGELSAAQNDAVIAIVAEGRRLYIGNLAYATTEEDLNAFFKGFLV
jgi:RNA recognition motif-containing protein